MGEELAEHRVATEVSTEPTGLVGILGVQFQLKLEETSRPVPSRVTPAHEEQIPKAGGSQRGHRPLEPPHKMREAAILSRWNRYPMCRASILRVMTLLVSGHLFHLLCGIGSNLLTLLSPETFLPSQERLSGRSVPEG